MRNRYGRAVVTLVFAFCVVSFIGCSSNPPGQTASTVAEDPAVKWEGKLVKLAGKGTIEHDKVYIVRGGKRLWILTPEWVLKNGYRFEDVRELPQGELERIPPGNPIQ